MLASSLTWVPKAWGTPRHSEKANLAVTLVNSNNEVIAFAAFFDYLNIPSVDQASWDTWMEDKYDTAKASVSQSVSHQPASQSSSQSVNESVSHAVSQCFDLGPFNGLKMGSNNGENEEKQAQGI
ncbi:hypothetical protein QZH41_003827 [Actinostola sp. cb2023]|nr:hypothetical protein QZH41_003827 [Actinostola sp. cb2023]